MRIFPISLIMTFIFFSATAHAAEYLRESVAKDYDENLREMFLHFHRNPELSNLESETAKRLAAEISALGYEVTEGVGGTGIVRADVFGQRVAPVVQDSASDRSVWCRQKFLRGAGHEFLRRDDEW